MSAQFSKDPLRQQTASARSLTKKACFSQLHTHIAKATSMAICLFTLVACATNPSHNIPLTLKSQGEYDFRNWIVESGKFNNGIEHKDTLIALSFSGGGLRAAALAAAVVEKLKELKLYDRVAIISSTSGVFRLSRKWTFRPLELRVNGPRRRC